MFLISAIKPIVEKKFKTFFFKRLFRGPVLSACKQKTVLFFYAVGFLAAIKTLHIRKEKI